MEAASPRRGQDAPSPTTHGFRTKADFAHYHLQKRSVTLLLVGASCGFLGFLCSTIIGIHKFLFTPTGINYLGDKFQSGNNYRPQTVSEMVHDTDTPEGKAFFAFCLMGAMCILASWYSWQLRNVYVGDNDVLCCRCGPAWANVRHYLPPLGMLMVICIPVTPPSQRDFGEAFALWMHSLGAVAMIGGYGITELHCLVLAAATRERDVFFKPGEWCLRFLIVCFSLLCGVAFQVCIVITEKTTHWPCADDWRLPSEDDLSFVAHNRSLRHLEVRIAEAIRNNRTLLYDTAYGECLWIKTGEFWFEVLAGFFMICSLWCIWYCALERHMDMPEKLPDVPKHFLRSQGYAEAYVQRGCDVEPSSVIFPSDAIGKKCEEGALDEGCAQADASASLDCSDRCAGHDKHQLATKSVVPGVWSGPVPETSCWRCFSG